MGPHLVRPRATPPNTLAIRPCRLLPWNPRYQIITLCFLATLTAYVERTGFSIAYTGMAKTAGLSESVKGTVLSAFYWGYALSQVDFRADLGPLCAVNISAGLPRGALVEHTCLHAAHQQGFPAWTNPARRCFTLPSQLCVCGMLGNQSAGMVHKSPPLLHINNSS